MDEHTHTHCPLCSRELDEPWHRDDPGTPLCDFCEAVGRAHAKVVRLAAQYEADCRNDPFLDRRYNR